MGSFLTGIFDDATDSIEIAEFAICLVCALVIGILIALAYICRARYTKSFVVTVALLPAVVCVVIMVVNGNVGAGVAVAGAFSLVRFRSAPGSAEEIVELFLAMAAGIVCGMGYIAYAFLFTILLCIFTILYGKFDFGISKKERLNKTLRITIPENLDYTSIFDDIFENYTSQAKLMKAKTSNLGSMYKLTYNIVLKDAAAEKDLIDEIRCRNGNLEVSVSVLESEGVAL